MLQGEDLNEALKNKLDFISYFKNITQPNNNHLFITIVIPVKERIRNKIIRRKRIQQKCGLYS